MKSAKLSRKIIAISLVACMTASCAVTSVGSYIGLSTTVNAASITSDGFEYDVDYVYFYDDDRSEETIKITGYTGSNTNVVIPSSIDGKKVTSIDSSAFYNNAGISSVTIPDSVETIYDKAFAGCTGLTGIIIPDSVKKIYYSAFEGCAGITSLSIGSGVTSIDNYAFSGCVGLRDLTIPENVTSIAYNAFEGCTGLRALTVNCPNLDTAFSGCTGLTRVTFGDNVKSIGYCAFAGCTGLKTISIPDNITSIADGAFRNTGLTSITLGKNITKIASETFCGCKYLASVTLSNSVTSIGSDAFSGCKRLTSITIPDSVAIIESSAFSDCTGLASAVIGKKVTKISSYAFKGCKGLKSITIPDSVTYLGSSAFEDCTGLTSVKIGNNLTVIGDCAFKNCTGLKSITIPQNVTEVGESAFEDCTGLTSLKISDGVVSIGNNAFKNCTGLTSVVIPGSVTMGDFVFYGCTGLTNAVISNGVVSIGEYAFSDCTELTSVVIPDSVTLTGDYAFYNCTKMKSVTIPESVISIGQGAFGYYSVDYWNDELIDGFTIYGTAGSEAETYANDNDIKFVTGLINNSTISKTTINKGDSITLKGSATGGTAPYQYTYCYKKASSSTWTTVKNWSSSTSVSITPAVATTYDVCIKVKDAKGTISKKYFKVNVTAPLANNSTISKSTITKGDSVTLKAVATGGTAPYQYAFYVKHSASSNWTMIKSYNTTATKTWTPARTGTYQVCAKVKDSKGTVAKKYFTLTVNAPLANNSTISKTTINKCESVTLKGSATGGTAPYQYAFYVKHSASSNWTMIKSYNTTATKTWTPARTGTYQVCAKVKDSKGTVAKKYFTLTIK